MRKEGLLVVGVELGGLEGRWGPGGTEGLKAEVTPKMCDNGPEARERLYACFHPRGGPWTVG